jgi:hypothetical protein
MLLGESAVGLSSINSRCLRSIIQIYLCQRIYREKQALVNNKISVSTVFCMSYPTCAYLNIAFILLILV